MEIKGIAVMAIRDFVKSKFNEKYNEWLNYLSNDSKSIFNVPIDATKWYLVEKAAAEPTKAIIDLFYQGDTRTGAWESGSFSAEKALTGIYKVFVLASSPTFIISRAKDIFARYYRPCEMTIIDKKPNEVTLQIINTKESDLIIEYRIGGWINKALEISGCKKVSIELSKSITWGDEVTEFKISWIS